MFRTRAVTHHVRDTDCGWIQPTSEPPTIFGDATRNWLIFQNETCTIGLFQGMLEKNTLTFNPSWDRAGNTLPEFDDVRDIQKSLKG